MPKKKPRHWFTIVYYTTEGAPHPAYQNGEQWSRDLETLVDDLKRSMTSKTTYRGAYAVGAYAGRLRMEEILDLNPKPTLYVFPDGHVDVLE
jgi:hypothetical protein